MIRLIAAQLRRRPGRAGALFAGIIAATTGFTVLTGSVTTSKLEVTQTVEANFRAAYDILVRPSGVRTTLEDERNLVRPNYLSGQLGGITIDQWAKVKQVTGVDVAAPIAMLGYAPTVRSTMLDLTDYVDRSKTQQVLRLTPTWIADRGLTRADDAPWYVYITKNPVITREDTTRISYSDGTLFNLECPGPLEVLPSGRKVPICGTRPDLSQDTNSRESTRSWFHVFRLMPDGTFSPRDAGYALPASEPGNPRLLVYFGWWSVVGAAAIDPDEESRLVGLDRSIVDGRYLSAADKPRRDNYNTPWMPVLESTQLFDDERFAIGVDRLADGTIRPFITPEQQRKRILAVSGTALGVIEAARTDDGHDFADNAYTGTLRIDCHLGSFLQIGQTRYETQADGSLAPAVVPATPNVWLHLGTDAHDSNLPPIFAEDTAMRPVDLPHPSGEIYIPDIVGRFDPGLLAGFSSVSRVPLETYAAPEASGVDVQARRLLGGRPLRPNSNPSGYLAQPPLVLTSLTAGQPLFNVTGTAAAPISAIRVRVADVQHFDALTRERIRNIAEQITLATGLDVDITVGSSPSAQTIVLPAGRYGRPELRLSEGWSKKGVAVAIIKAIDRKSAILFGLILVVCLLFLGNAATAAVRDRRRELAVLACVGWPRRRLAQLIVAEIAALGLASGAASALLARPISGALHVAISPTHAALAIPVALGSAIVAALIPAVRASRTHPAAALAPVGATGHRRRWGRSRSVAGLALRNSLRMRGRTALGVLAMALGVGALTVIAALEWAFHGQITGSVLGEVVSVRVRGVDTIAVAATVLLAAAAVADILYLNVRERAAELAALQATGWSGLALGRLVTYEGLLIGAVGAILGAGLGLLAVDRLAGAPNPLLLQATIIAGGIGIALAALAALVPALLTRRLPITTLLAEE